MTTVGPLMIPRMYHIWYEKRYGHLPEGVLTFGTGQTHINGVQSSPSRLQKGGANKVPLPMVMI